ncbi:MAG: hypothetical protein AAGB12_06650 [Pseudomonadota bacterium]
MRQYLSAIGYALASTASWGASIHFPIIDQDVCQVRGSYLYNCAPTSVSQHLTPTYAYVPLETHVTLDDTGYCTLYDLVFTVTADGQVVDSRHVFSTDTFIVPQAHATLAFSVTTPPGYYLSQCEASATITTDVLNRPQLNSNLRVLKASTTAELNDVLDLIAKQETIIDLSAVVSALNTLITFTEAELNNYYAITETLDASCPDGDRCSWSSHMLRIIDENLGLSFADQLLLFTLGQSLDNLTPEACSVGECAADVISEDVAAVIAGVTEKVPDETTAEAELVEYHTRQRQLTSQLSEYQSVAQYYGLDWYAL